MTAEWEWKTSEIRCQLSGYRDGWRGLWDHFRELFGGPRRIVQRDVTLSVGFWTKSAFDITGLSVTKSNPPEQNQDYQNEQDQPDDAAGIRAPRS